MKIVAGPQTATTTVTFSVILGMTNNENKARQKTDDCNKQKI